MLILVLPTASRTSARKPVARSIAARSSDARALICTTRHHSPGCTDTAKPYT
ncbi:hypothetical protein GCM10009759_23160 [Kitasatospora saccharophila]|uniref:Uncharacterized protein n=1 Tax=Kitasatospora saccharophila TaxID=407973 RepID=A0ABN2WLU9_9ACTN